jgi:hypothetical protein
MPAANLTRVATIALMLVPVLAAGAYADDEYGTGHEVVTRHAATSAMVPMAIAAQAIVAEGYGAGQNDNFGAPQRDALIRQSATRGSIAVLVDVARAKTSTGGYATDGGYGPTDLVGGGGRQDELAREIYRPGSGTDF